MRKVVLAINAGSSTLKVGIFDFVSLERCANGIIEQVGDYARIILKDGEGSLLVCSEKVYVESHQEAIYLLLNTINIFFENQQVVGVGHRVVHGGMKHAAPTLVGEAVLNDLSELIAFAPLHQPHNIAGVHATMELFPEALQVLCFDTSFHRSKAFVHESFALPRSYFDRGVRRYGFHGLSYEYVTNELAYIAPKLHRGRVVICHLGNGASACAVKAGQSVATSMGFSALDGLTMGTRCGYIDPGVILFLLEQEGLSAQQVSELLYNRSGLLGLSNVSSDMRLLQTSCEVAAREAIDYFVARIREEIARLAAAMGGIDGLVFCGGIGENSPLIRRLVCDEMTWIGIQLDPLSNENSSPVISSDQSLIEVRTIPTNEELVIAKATASFVRNREEFAI